MVRSHTVTKNGGGVTVGAAHGVEGGRRNGAHRQTTKRQKNKNHKWKIYASYWRHK